MTREQLLALADTIAAELNDQRAALTELRKSIRFHDEQLMVLHRNIRRLPASLDDELVFTRSVA